MFLQSYGIFWLWIKDRLKLIFRGSVSSVLKSVLKTVFFCDFKLNFYSLVYTWNRVGQFCIRPRQLIKSV